MSDLLDLRPWAGSLSLVVLVYWLGATLIRRWGGGRGEMPAAFAVGLLSLNLWFRLIDLLGLAWSMPLLLAPGLLAWWLGRSNHGREPASLRTEAERGKGVWSWGEWTAALCVGLFAYAALSLRAMSPDFIYHWGIKGRRFFEAGGIDWEFLARPGAGYLHPDYPLLVSNYFGASAVLGRTWAEAPLMLWGVAALLLLILEGRAALIDGGVKGTALALGVAVLALVLTAFSMAQEQAGAADLLFALCVMGAARQLMRLAQAAMEERSGAAANSRALARIGLWSALAVATKIEGAPFAVIAVTVAAGVMMFGSGTRRQRSLLHRITSVLACWPLWVPSFVVGAWWLADLFHWGLFQASNSGIPSWERVRTALEATPQVLSMEAWTGVAWLVLLLPVMMLLRPWGRAIGLRVFVSVAALQMCVYYFTYFGAAQDTAFWVLSSLPRLIFHVMPVTLVSIIVWLHAPQSEGTQHSQ